MDTRAHDPPARVVEESRPWRTPSIVLFVLAHAAGALLVALGEWQAGVTVALASHMPFVWGTLVPSSRILGPVVSRFDTSRREVWLTIDDGPSQQTPEVLDALDAHGARATFFLVARRAQAHPDTVAEIVRRGHAIGNHTATHPSASFWAALPRRLEREIGGAQDALTRLGGSAPRLFRAVVGMANPCVAAVLRRHGLVRVAWSARGFDSTSADPARVWARIERGLRPGAIVLLHDGARHGASAAIVRHVLRELDARGYRSVLPVVDACEARPA